MKKKTDRESLRDQNRKLGQDEMFTSETHSKSPEDYEKELLSSPEDEVVERHLFDEDGAFQRLDSRLRAEKLVPTGRKWTHFRYLGLAASLLLIAVSIWVFNVGQYKVSDNPLAEAKILTKFTLRGQKLKAQLPDGSLVWLNAESSISYPEHFGTSRTVSLKGEAFFDVKENLEKPFIIQAGDAEIKVLGTSFNVKAYPEEKLVETVVVTGTVEVEGSKAQKSVTLIPNQKAVYDYSENSLWKEAVEVQETVSWRDGILIFTDAGLPDVIKKLERWFNVEIEVTTDATIANCKVTATFDNLALEQILKQLQFITPVKYEIKEGQVTLRGEGC